MESYKIHQFLDGLNSFLWDRILVLDLDVYSKRVNKAVLSKKDSERI